MKVSVLIATRDRPQALRRCLASIARQDYTDLEVLVIDDASAIPVNENELRVDIPAVPIRFSRSDTRLGLVGCRNVLMQSAQGALFIILDDDACLADVSGIRHAVTAFEHHPDVGILAFKLIEKTPGYEGLLVPHGQRRIRKHPQLVDQVTLVAHYLGGGHALRRSVIDQCGYFSDDLFYGHEELDLSYRALDAGFQILYLPTVLVHHYRDVSASSLGGWRLYHLVRNRMRIAFTYLPASYAAVHIGSWLLWYGWQALRNQALGAYGRGVRDGLAGMKRRDRHRMRPETIAYLKAHYGRLWF